VAETPDAPRNVDRALELRKVTKRFGSITANLDVDLSVGPGEIRGLVGENGAGKSTLMAIASGLYRPDAGSVIVNGTECDFHGRDEAIALGINMVHQHFMLVSNCTVAQNVVLGRKAGSPWLHMREREREVNALAERYGLDVDARARVEHLTPTERQRAEILVALWRGGTCLILDEPTSVLGPLDIEQLFATMRRVAGEGCAVIFTSHKLREVIEICDRITVMRHGEIMETVATSEADVHALATLMVGKEVTSRADAAPLIGETEAEPAEAERDRPRPAAGDAVLRLHPRSQPASGEAALGELAVAAGEIVGVAGVEGNGQLSLAETMAGLQRPAHIAVELAGRDISALGPAERASLGMSYVPEEPTSRAIVPAFPISWNIGLRTFREAGGRRSHWSIDTQALRSRAERAIEAFDIRGATPDRRTAALSGGNQQKVVLARELDGDPQALIIVSPTVGLDVGSASAIHDALRAHRDSGVAIVLISTDLDEIEVLSDRIAVLYRGKIVDVVTAAKTDRRTIGLMMTGLTDSRHDADPATGADLA
jgi:general nucleoside transport system ATP-binding protein